MGAPTARLLALAAACAATGRAAASVADGTPICGEATDRNSITLLLECAAGGVITGFDFASYGTPSGSCAGGNLQVNASCQYPGTLAWAEAACVNRSSCILTAGPALPDPCSGTIKSLAVVARCSGAAGGSVAPVVPPCALTQGTPPCPLPQWAPVWQLNRSTICQPGMTADYLDPAAAARWGLVSLDWSIAYNVWHGDGQPANMTGAATLVEQCRRIKQVDSTTRCFVYRNTELALEWMEPHRAVMDDPAFSDFFLQYQPGNPSNATPGTPYNEDAQGIGAGLRQFFWNYSNPDALQYVLGVSEQGALATASEWVDGTFSDDVQAVPQEHPDAAVNMGLSPVQLLRAQNDTYRYFNTALATLAAGGKYIWQGFNGNQQGDPDGAGAAPIAGTCAPFMRAICNPAWQAVPATMQWPSAQQDKLPVLAAFLVTRGPYAYIGYGWNGQSLPAWDPLWDAYDVGQPAAGAAGLCAEGPAGVFSRQWTNGVAQLDCNTWTASLNFTS